MDCAGYDCELETIVERMRKVKIYGKVVEKAIELNIYPGVDVFVCINGETQVFSLTVMQDKSLVYQNRFFMRDMMDKMPVISDHLDKMLEVAQCGEIITQTESQK